MKRRIDYDSYRAKHMTRADYLLYGARTTAKRGEALPQSKLDEQKVRYVKANPKGLTARELAKELGVHYRSIENIRQGKYWVMA